MLLALLLACSEPAPTPATAPTPAPPKEARTRTLTLAAYTTPREAYGKSILPASAEEWKKKTGEDVKFEASYQGSGAQARAVKEGLEADVVALSLDPDVAVLEAAGLVAPSWRNQANGGIVTNSIAVIAVRAGNPKGIKDWADLSRPDVEVLTPNVKTSGGAMWNVAAIYGSGSRGGTPAAGEKLLSGILGRVSVMDKGARESIVTFEKGIGDAAITYENEVLVAKQEGKEMDYVVPPATILIENPIAVVDTYAKKHGNEDLASAFVTFCLGESAQKAFPEYGLRPGDAKAPTTLPTPPALFTVRDLGGWDVVKKDLFAEGGVYDRALQAGQKK